MEPTNIKLEKVKETLLLPLWGRSFENRKQKPLLVDNKAEEIIAKIDYDFSKLEGNVHPLTRAAWISRSIYFDEKIIEYLANNPNGVILNLGCGLDTTYDRINIGKGKWYEVDFNEVIQLRKKYLQETENRKFVAGNIVNDEWLNEIVQNESAFVLMGGVIYYLEEDEVKKIFERLGKKFRKVEIVFDYSSKKGVQITNKKVLNKVGMSKESLAKWGIDNLREIVKWDLNIKIEENMAMFKRFKKKYPITKRLGFNISDKMRLLSLAKVLIISSQLQV